MRQVLVLALLLAPFAGQASAQEAGHCESKAVAQTKCPEQATQATSESSAESCDTLSTAVAVAQAPASKRGWCDRMEGGKKKTASCDSAKAVAQAKAGHCDSRDAATIAIAVPVREPGASCSEAARFSSARKPKGGCDKAAMGRLHSVRGSSEIATIAVAVPAAEGHSEMAEKEKGGQGCCAEDAEEGAADAKTAPVAKASEIIAIGHCETTVPISQAAAKSDCGSAKSDPELATIAIQAPASESRCKELQVMVEEAVEKSCCDEDTVAEDLCEEAEVAPEDCRSKETVPTSAFPMKGSGCEDRTAETVCEAPVGTVAKIAVSAPVFESFEKPVEVAGSTDDEDLAVFRVQKECSDKGAMKQDCDDRGDDARRAQPSRVKVLRLGGGSARAPMAWSQKEEGLCDDGARKAKGERQQFEIIVMTDEDGPHGDFFAPQKDWGRPPHTDMGGSDNGDCCSSGARSSHGHGQRMPMMNRMKMNCGDHDGGSSHGDDGDRDGCGGHGGGHGDHANRGGHEDCDGGHGGHDGGCHGGDHADRGGHDDCGGGHGDRGDRCGGHDGWDGHGHGQQWDHGKDHCAEGPSRMRTMKRHADHGMSGRQMSCGMGNCCDGPGPMMKPHRAHGMGMDLPKGIEMGRLRRLLQLGDRENAKVSLRVRLVRPDGDFMRSGDWKVECDDDDECGFDDNGADREDACRKACEEGKAEGVVHSQRPAVAKARVIRLDGAQVWKESLSRNQTEEDESSSSCEKQPAAAPKVIRYRAEPAAAVVKIDRMAEIEKRIAKLELQLVRIEALLDSIANG